MRSMCVNGVAAWLIFALAGPVAAQSKLPAAFHKAVPETIQDLQAIEKHVQKLVDKVMPATVCLSVGNSAGSGIFVDREGLIITAGHVSGEPGRAVTIILPDGRRLRGKTLGANNNADSGMVLLTEKADFPIVEMAKSGEAKVGDWCLALGHPGGLKPDRPPVVRLGRVQEITKRTLVTDCALVGGDSGGPLFDMHGRVIAIHSRIGGKVHANVHVPIDTYHNTWDRLAAGEVWGSPFPTFDFFKQEDAYLGIRPIADKKSLKIEAVTPGSPAETAGLKANDVILKVDGKALATPNELGTLLKTRRPGAQINVVVQRGDSMMTIPVVLGKRAN